MSETLKITNIYIRALELSKLAIAHHVYTMMPDSCWKRWGLFRLRPRVDWEAVTATMKESPTGTNVILSGFVWLDRDSERHKMEVHVIFSPITGATTDAFVYRLFHLKEPDGKAQYKCGRDLPVLPRPHVIRSEAELANSA